MARYQLVSNLLLLVVLLVSTSAEVPRRLRGDRQRQRQLFSRQEVAPTPYPSADELKPEEPALIYGPPPSTDVEELPVEEISPTISFQTGVDTDVEAEELETEVSSLEVTAPIAVARLRSSPQRLAKLQLAKLDDRPKDSPQRHRIARLEASALAATAATAVPTSQLYYIGAQQSYLVSYNPSGQHVAW